MSLEEFPTPEVNEDGCPCMGTCCSEPYVTSLRCNLDDPSCQAETCECCWTRECLTCGATCRCEV